MRYGFTKVSHAVRSMVSGLLLMNGAAASVVAEQLPDQLPGLRHSGWSATDEGVDLPFEIAACRYWFESRMWFFRVWRQRSIFP